MEGKYKKRFIKVFNSVSLNKPIGFILDNLKTYCSVIRLKLIREGLVERNQFFLFFDRNSKTSNLMLKNNEN